MEKGVIILRLCLRLKKRLVAITLMQEAFLIAIAVGSLCVPANAPYN